MFLNGIERMSEHGAISGFGVLDSHRNSNQPCIALWMAYTTAQPEGPLMYSRMVHFKTPIPCIAIKTAHPLVKQLTRLRDVGCEIRLRHRSIQPDSVTTSTWIFSEKLGSIGVLPQIVTIVVLNLLLLAFKM